MTAIDYGKLNDAATKMIGMARRQAAFDVEEKTRIEVSLDHGINKLDIIIGLCENVGPTTTPSGETERVLAAWVRRATGSVPLFGASEHIEHCKNALGSEGFLPNWELAARYANKARDILMTERINHRSNN